MIPNRDHIRFSLWFGYILLNIDIHLQITPGSVLSAGKKEEIFAPIDLTFYLVQIDNIQVMISTMKKEKQTSVIGLVNSMGGWDGITLYTGLTFKVMFENSGVNHKANRLSTFLKSGMKEKQKSQELLQQMLPRDLPNCQLCNPSIPIFIGLFGEILWNPGLDGSLQQM